MPIFQDPDRQRFYDLWSDDHPKEDEQQALDSSWDTPQTRSWKYETPGLDTQSSAARRTPDLDLPVMHANDRQELIQYLKRTDTSVWSPTRLVCLIIRVLHLRLCCIG